MRGVYFTSGAQVGNPIDRVMAAIADGLGMRGKVNLPPAQPAEGKSFFLYDVFTNVIFPDQDVAARSQAEVARERKRRVGIAAVRGKPDEVHQ
jgi:type VI secretion system protein ImpL